MVALAASDWIVNSSDIKTFDEEPYRRIGLMTLPAAGEYPSLGIPIPKPAKFGLRVLRDIHPMTVVALNATASTPPVSLGMTVNYDNTNRTVRLHTLSTASITPQGFVEMATTALPGPLSIYVEIHGH